ncbi:MAG: class I SAM-dependent RNA methyltransferase [Proteobacteria bacterium]|nr:MAG: class I SAM-dependent RNA methyltransferase [Pseudomonadota bacterium]
MDASYAKSTQTHRLELYLDHNEEPKWSMIGDEKDGIGFSQVNRFQNDDLLKTALEWSQGPSYQRIVDLYAGSGNFTFHFADHYRSQQIIAAELDSKLVQRAQQVVQSSNLYKRRTQFYVTDVASFLKRTQLQSTDLVILDPPRAGADLFVMNALAHSPVQKIIYISCHPVSLARDLKYFFETQDQLPHKQKLKLKRIQCFEMFPQTDHVETIAELAVDTQ